MHNTVQTRRLDLILWYLMKVVWYSFSLCVLTISPLVWLKIIPKSTALAKALHGQYYGWWIGAVITCFVIGCLPAYAIWSNWRHKPTSNPFLLSLKQGSKLFMFFMLVFVTPFALGSATKDRAFSSPATWAIVFNVLVLVGSQLCGHIYAIHGYGKLLRKQLTGSSSSSSGYRAGSSRYGGIA